MATADEWTFEKEKLLIKLFKCSEALWMKSHPLYSSVRARKDAMLQMSTLLRIDEKAILLKLKVIKSHLYAFCRSKLIIDKGKRQPCQSGYRLFDECDFFLKEINKRTTKRNWKQHLLVEGCASPQVLYSELRAPIVEENLFHVIMQSYYSLGARKEYEFDWNTIANALRSHGRHSQRVKPGKAKETWSNMSLGIIKACENLCPGCAGSNLDVWKALEWLVKVPTESIPKEHAWINKLVSLFSSTSSRFCEYDNELLFELIEKKPILKQIFQKCKKNLRNLAWEEVANEYNAIKHPNTDKFRLKKHWLTLLRTIELRMIMFRRSMNEAPIDGNICAPTDFEKRIIQRNPKLLILSKNRDCLVIPFLDKCATGKESNERASEPFVDNCAAGKESAERASEPFLDKCSAGKEFNEIPSDPLNLEDSTAEMTSQLDPANKKAVKGAGMVFKSSGKLEIIDIHTGDEEQAMVSKVNEDFVDDLEVKHVLCGLASKEQLSDEDVSFLLVKWLSANAKERKIDSVPTTTYSAFATKDNTWDTISQKFQPYCPQNPKELFKKWKHIFFHALCNVELNTRNHSDMTDLDWMVLQSFPSMFIKSTKNRKSIDDNSSNTTNSTTALPSETILSESSEQTPVLSADTTTLASEDNTRLPGYREGTEIAQVKKEPIQSISDIPSIDSLSLDQPLPELKRHQKPIILSDKTEVLKMNQQLQTAAVSPNCSKSKANRIKKGEKLTLLKKCQNGQVMDVQLTWGQKKKETIEKRYLSYRPNPKFGMQTPSWMTKPKRAEVGVPVVKPEEPVVKFVDKIEAYQNFLNTLEKFSQCKPKPACTVYTPPEIKEMHQNLILDRIPITEGTDNTPETIDLFSDSTCDSDGSILNFAALREIAARNTEAKAMHSAKRRRVRGNRSNRRVNSKFDKITSINVSPKRRPYIRRKPKSIVGQNNSPERDDVDQALLVPIRSEEIFKNLSKKRGRPPKLTYLPSSDDGEIANPNKSHFAEISSSSEEDSRSDWSSHYKTAVKRKIYSKNLRSEKINISNVNQDKARDEQTPSEVMNLVITAPILDKPITMEVNITPTANDVGGRALLSNPDLLTGTDVEPGELLSFFPITYEDLQPIIKRREETLLDLIPTNDPLDDTTTMDSQKEIVTSADHVDIQQGTATSVIPEEDNIAPTDSSKIDLRSYYSMMADSLDFSNLDDGDFDFGDLEDGEILDSENSAVVPVSINEAEHTLDADEDSSYILPELADSIPTVKRLHKTIINISDSEDEIPLANFTKRSKNNTFFKTA